jgi:hypothetical protein
MTSTKSQQQPADREHDATERVPAFRPRGNEVRIRMYGQGLGDCFLLAFPRTRPTPAVPAGDTERPVYVLIDCGVITGTPNASQRLKRIVRDIRLTTRDDSLQSATDGLRGHLDLLILTHEHWDHLSGFIDAQNEWKQIQVDQLWMSWMEKDDPNGLAGVLQKLEDKQRRALVEVVKRAAQAPQEERLQIAAGIASFLSEARFNSQEFAVGRSLGDGLKFAKTLVANEDDRTFCEPGEVHAVPGTSAVAYVLGPPQDWERLNTMNPSANAPETYVGAQEHGLAELRSLFTLGRMLDHRSPFNAFVMPLLGPALAATDETDADEATLAEQDLFDRSFPFDRTIRVPIPTAEAASSNAAAAYPALSSYFSAINQWRRIDFDWLAAADSFALAVDNFVNNTSLALAFELPAHDGEERKVLLFVADAQVGNWLSWDDITEWRPQPDAQPVQQTPNLGDLFRRAAFYKVGHHGSHNATLKEKGVERMRNDGQLTAFVPVSANVAHAIKDWMEMPLEEMLNALAARTEGRVVFPNGNVWDHEERRERSPTARERERIGLEQSEEMLPEKKRELDDGTIVTIEEKVPLWVQTAVDY